MKIKYVEDLKQMTLDVKLLKQGMSVHLYYLDGLLFSDRRLPPQSCVGQSPTTGGR